MILNGDQYPPANIGLPTFISQTVIHGVFYTKLRNRERIYSDLFQSKNNVGQKKFTKKIPGFWPGNYRYSGGFFLTVGVNGNNNFVPGE